MQDEATENRQLASRASDDQDGFFEGRDRKVEMSVASNQMTVHATAADLIRPVLPYPLVAVGASAGGLQAFRDVLVSLPEKTGMTFVLVTHLAPDLRSYLAEIMERHTKMPVLAIEEGVQPKPDHVYVLLPNQYVRMRRGSFHLEERKSSDRTPATIDTFFRSVAKEQGEHAVGVVLSGADSDGASGLKVIKGEGGFAIVQSPDSALHSSMPRNSIAADYVDVILPPAEIARELARLAHQFSRAESLPEGAGKLTESGEPAFQSILRLLQEESGLELRLYKPDTIRRRLARRMMLLRIESLAEYQRLLQARPDELQKLREDVLINITSFFRDDDFWHALQTTVFPRLFQDRSAESPLRVWCAGCSTGEEVYSMAIALLEYTSQQNLDTPIQIFGTDASERSITMARNAVYPETTAGELSPERIRRFFVKTERGYQVTKRVRDLCIFAKQNLSNDPPFSHIDILTCRNVMIYFNEDLQQRVLATFHYSLESGGYMALGIAEGLRDLGEVFHTVDRKNKIYAKSAGLVLDSEMHRNYRSVTLPLSRPTGLEPPNFIPESDLQRTADRIALARYSPAGMIVDERMHVIQLRGQTSEFIEPAPGTVSWNLVRVLRGDISTGVSQAVQRAIQDETVVSTSFAFLSSGGTQQTLQVDVLPIASTGAAGRYFLVFLQANRQQHANAQSLSSSQSAGTSDVRDRLVAQQEQDLISTRAHLQSLIQERDQRNQELVSANEEIQAANEELQSINEELGTTKEELQSANEELQTVNDELQRRNLVLAQTGNDVTDMLSSASIPILTLSSELCIRHFTSGMQSMLRLRPGDIGRPIGDINLHLQVDDLETLLAEVLEDLSVRKLEVQDSDGRWHLLFVRPYRTFEDKIEGLVLVLMDIDEFRTSQQSTLDARDFARSVIECVPLSLIVLRDDLTVQVANTAFRSMAGMRSPELQDRSFPELVQHLWGFDVREAIESALRDHARGDFALEYESKLTDSKAFFLRGQCVQSEGKKVVLVTMEDITSSRDAESLLKQQKRDLQTEIAVAAITLDRSQEELRNLTAHLFSVQEEERRKIARELHDDISQRLSFLELLLRDVESFSVRDDHNEKMNEARQHLQALTTDVRNLSHQLHSAILDDLGLSAALKALVTEFQEREGMPANYLSRNLPPLPMQPGVTALYRIAQEALRNVAKHAGKTHVKVILECRDEKLRLEVVDLGIGFDQESDVEIPIHGLGMISMKERAHMAHGTLSVRSSLGYGTTVTVEVPFDRES